MGPLLLAGSTALILFAIRFLRKGLDRLLGTRFGSLSSQLATTPARGFLAGGLMAAVAPSSTSMATVISRLALEERVPQPAALAMMLGANVGLTSLVLIGAAGLEGWYPALLVAGVLMFQFMRSEVTRGIGQVVLSLGFVFLGMHLTKQAVPVLRGGDLDALLALATNHELILALAACLLTVAMQSSSVTILLLMCLADAHPFGLNAILAVVAGANFGLVGTALVIAWREPRSRLPALGNAAIKGSVSLAAIAVAVIAGPHLLPVPGDPRAAAATHLVIALAAAAIGLVCGPAILRQLARTPFARPPAAVAAGPRYLDIEVDGDTRLAMANSRREILHVSEKARAMLEQVWLAWTRGDRLLARSVARLDDQIDDLDRDIKAYLARNGVDGDPAAQHEQICQLRYVTQLEAIGDVIEKQLSELVVKGTRHAADMPLECRQRLDDTCRAVLRTLLTAETAFATRDHALAERLLAIKARIGQLNRAERDRSLWRRRSGVPHEAEAIYLDLLAGLKRINSCACSVAYDIIAASPPSARSSTGAA